MTGKELRDMEAAMTKEKIIERAKTLRPVADFQKLGGMRYWLDGNKIHQTSYNWDKKRLKPTGYLRELGRVKTYHTGTPFFLQAVSGGDGGTMPVPRGNGFHVCRRHLRLRLRAGYMDGGDYLLHWRYASGNQEYGNKMVGDYGKRT